MNLESIICYLMYLFSFIFIMFNIKIINIKKELTNCISLVVKIEINTFTVYT